MGMMKIKTKRWELKIWNRSQTINDLVLMKCLLISFLDYPIASVQRYGVLHSIGVEPTVWIWKETTGGSDSLYVFQTSDLGVFFYFFYWVIGIWVVRALGMVIEGCIVVLMELCLGWFMVVMVLRLKDRFWGFQRNNGEEKNCGKKKQRGRRSETTMMMVNDGKKW